MKRKIIGALLCSVLATGFVMLGAAIQRQADRAKCGEVTLIAPEKWRAPEPVASFEEPK